MAYLLSAEGRRKKRVVRAIVVHHSQSYMHLAGLQTAEEAIRDIARTHKKKGFGNIGYHGVVDRDGHCHWTKDPLTAGTHALARNSDTLGFCFLGDFLGGEGRVPQVPTPEQVAVLRGLAQGILPPLEGLICQVMAADRGEPDLTMPGVLGHNEIMDIPWAHSLARPGYTECPGNLMEYLKE